MTSHRRSSLTWTAVAAPLLLVAASCSSGAGSDVAVAAAAVDAPTEVTTIRWYVGLGTGSSTTQLSAQRAVVDSFNEAHDDIELELEVVDNVVAFDVLQDRIAAGDAPDLVGPVGIRGANAFDGQFLDLMPYIADDMVDLDLFDAQQVEVWREQDGALTALPFGVFPSMIYYNRDLFDRAGLPYPPHEFGEMYNGEEWNADALYRTALLLTLDASGRNAISPEFDSEHVVQWGFHHQNVGDARAQGTLFGAGSFVADDGSSQIPEAWLAEWQWYHDLVWADYGAPDQREIDSGLLNDGNTFASGNVAMVVSHLWYTGSLRNEQGPGADFFDLAVVPSYDDTVTSKVHADTFRILESTEHPSETVEALAYLIDDAAADLLQVYGSLPARLDLRDSFFAELDATFPQDVDWSVAETSLEHPDIPSHEGPMPNFAVAEARIDEFEVLLTTDPDLDVSAAADQLRLDLADIFAAVQP